MSSRPVDYIEIGHVRVFTASMVVAARVAAKVKRSRQRGVSDGVRWECLTFPRPEGVGYDAGGCPERR